MGASASMCFALVRVSRVLRKMVPRSALGTNNNMSKIKFGKTIKNEVTIIGKNRKGNNTIVTMKPSKIGGIYFNDGKGNNIFNLLEAADLKVSSRLHLKSGEFEVFDAEHILAACASLGITDLRIVCPDGLPFPDFTPSKYFDYLKLAEVVDASISWATLDVNKRIVHADKDGSWAEIVPSPDEKYHIEVVICANGPVNILGVRFQEDDDFSSFATARPMIVAERDKLPQDVKDNAIIVWDGEFKTLPKDEEEIIRHTASDVLGCLAMLGPIPPVTIRTLNPNTATMIKVLRKYQRARQKQFNKQ